jgi:hypothetical protein
VGVGAQPDDYVLIYEELDAIALNAQVPTVELLRALLDAR